MTDLRQLHLGDLRTLLDHPFWASEAGRTFFRAIADEVAADILSCLNAYADALDGGDDNAVISVVDSAQVTVAARGYAVVYVAMSALCRAASAARNEAPISLSPRTTEPGLEPRPPSGWVRLAAPPSSDHPIGDEVQARGKP